MKTVQFRKEMLDYKTGERYHQTIYQHKTGWYEIFNRYSSNNITSEIVKKIKKVNY